MQATLVGRDRELGVIGDAIGGISDRGAALLIRGEPGIGKSALLDAAAAMASAAGVRTLSVVGVQSEAVLPYAGLHQLLRPCFVHVDRLPARQREALRSAFGLGGDLASPEVFFVALAALELLGDAAVDGAPLLVLVEDAHWLDGPTVDVLTFIARRLRTEPVVMLIALRDDHDLQLSRVGVRELTLGGLDDVAAGALLDLVAPDLAVEVRRELLALADGNPLALEELPHAVAEFGPAATAPTPLPLTARLEQAFADRLAALPAPTSTALLVAAADEVGDTDAVLRATALVEPSVPRDVLTTAVEARLIDPPADRLRFRHPLARSATYYAADHGRRRAAHAALAAVLDDQPDRQTWHRAASLLTADAATADALESAATRALDRGDRGFAARALERSARLSPAPAARAGRLLAAAELLFSQGRQDAGRQLVHEAELLPMEPADRALLAWLREWVGDPTWSGADSLRTLVAMVEGLADAGHTERAMITLLSVALRSYWSDADDDVRRLLVRTADRIATDPLDPNLITTLAYASPVDHGATLIDRLGRLAPEAIADPAAALNLGTAATAVGAFDAAVGYLGRAVDDLRAHGALGLLAQAQVARFWAELFCGRWDAARAAADSAVELAGETEQPLWVVTAQVEQAVMAAVRGESAAAQELAASAESLLLPLGAHRFLSLVQLSRGHAALGAGEYEAAFEHLRRILDPGDLSYHPFVRGWAVDAFVEAAVAHGHAAQAREVADEMAELARRTHSPHLTAVTAFVRPLLATDDEAEALFAAALTFDLRRWPFHRARLLLAHGAWLRRRRRIDDARAPLREARDAFAALGAAAWGEHARRELRAAGETTRRSTHDAREELTAQEFEIARMAAEGLSNRQIGERLFLSHRTVGSHLYRMFPKLGVTSRSQLGTALEGR